MVSTKKHEALFHLVESSKQSVTQKEKQKVSCLGSRSTLLRDVASCPPRGYTENWLVPPSVGICRLVRHEKELQSHLWFTEDF